MTLFVYDKYFGQKPQKFVSEDEFEKFIDSESRNLNLVDEYQNTFQNRFLNLPEVDSLKKEQPFEGDFTQRVDNLKEELKTLMEPVLALEGKMTLAMNILNGETKIKTFEFNNVEYNKKNATEAYNLMFTEREKLFNDTFKEWDHKFITSHYKLALKHNFHETYINLIEQQKKIVNVYKKLIEIKNQIVGDINILQSKSEVTPSMVNSLSEDIIHYTFKINDEINIIDEGNFVSISNIDSVQELKEAIVDSGEIKKESGNIFENGGIGRIMGSIESGLINCNRVENKNIDEVLSLNKKLIEMQN